MKRFINISAKSVIFLTLLVFIAVTYSALLFINQTPYLNGLIKHPQCIYWFSAIMLFLFIIVICKFIDKWDNKKKQIIKYLMILFLVIGQIILLCNLFPIQVTDAYMVVEQAKGLFSGFDKIVDYVDTEYWQIVYNNNFIMLMLIGVMKFGSLIGANGITNYLVIFNALMIDLAIFFTYKVAQKLKGNDFALKVLLLCVLNPLNYVNIYWIYTNTLSWPFIIGSIYFVLLLKERKTIDLKFIIYLIILCIIAVTGFFLRPTMVIPLAAFVVTFIIYLIVKSHKVKPYVKQNLKKICLVILIIMISLGACYKITDYNIKQFYPGHPKNFPITNWLVMGLHGDGYFNREDFDYTYSFDTKEKMRKANIEEIKKTLKEYGTGGLVYHQINKIIEVWSGGYSIRAWNISKESKIYPYINGDKTDLINLWINSYRIMLFVLLLFSLINEFRSKKIDYRILFTIILFGVLIFYSLWEIKPDYSYPFISVVIILAAEVLDKFKNYGKNISEDKQKTLKNIGLTFVLLTTLMFGYLYKGLVCQTNTYKNYQLRAGYNNDYFIKNISKDKLTVKQEFYATDKFNSIDLSIPNMENTDAKYYIKLLTQNKEITSYVITRDNLKDYNLHLLFDIQKPKGKQKYCLIISSINQTDDALWLGYGYSRGSDFYEGDLTINDKKISSDLALSVYHEYQGTYFSKLQYLMLYVFVILMELFIIINLFGNITFIKRKKANKSK